MLGRLQRRPGPEAPPSAHLRFVRDWSWAAAAIGVILALQGALTRTFGAVWLEVSGALLVMNGAWMTVVAWAVARRERRRG